MDNLMQPMKGCVGNILLNGCAMWCNRTDMSPHIAKGAAIGSLNIKYMLNKTMQIQSSIYWMMMSDTGNFIMLILWLILCPRSSHLTPSVLYYFNCHFSHFLICYLSCHFIINVIRYKYFRWKHSIIHHWRYQMPFPLQSQMIIPHQLSDKYKLVNFGMLEDLIVILV